MKIVKSKELKNKQINNQSDLKIVLMNYIFFVYKIITDYIKKIES